MITLKGELLRKSIHIFSSVIPVIYYFVDKSFALSVLIPILLFMLTFEVLKYRFEPLQVLYLKIFGTILRPHEFNKKQFRINGASWLLLGNTITIILFPKLFAVTGMLMLSLADSMSAIIGRLYGRKKYAPNRTYAGTIAFFITGLLIIAAVPKYYYTGSEFLLYFVMLIFTTVADSITLPWDDNFTIPIVSGGSLFLLYHIVYPELNLTLFL